MLEAKSAKIAMIKFISFIMYTNGAVIMWSLLTSHTNKTHWFKLGYPVFLAIFNDALSQNRNVKA